MSVHQESLEMSKPEERTETAPELEYRAVSHDSLSMFLAAIGGAILGMLLTLLILALINGGTLSFTGGERLAVFTHGLGLAGLRERGAGGKCSNQRCKKNALHYFPPIIW